MKNSLITLLFFSLMINLVSAQKIQPKIDKNKLLEKKVIIDSKKEGQYALESDLYLQHNEQEIEKVKKRKKLAFTKIKNNNKIAEAEYNKHVSQEIDIAKTIREIIREVEKSRIDPRMKVFRVRPRPPCPDNDCHNDWLKGLLVSNTVKRIDAKVYNQKNKLLGELKKKPSMINKNGGYKVYDFIWKHSHSGPVVLKINRDSKEYLIKTTIKNP